MSEHDNPRNDSEGGENLPEKEVETRYDPESSSAEGQSLPDQSAPGVDSNSSETKKPTPLWLKKLPNRLTFLRIACIPVVVLLMLESDPVTPGEVAPVKWVDVAAAVVFGLAAITDFFDGWIARMFGAQSLLGKLLDPLADKLLVVAALIILVEKQRLAGWIAVVLIVRDLGINAIRIAAIDDNISLESSPIGKAKTLFLDLGIAGLMVHGVLWSIPFLLLGQISIGVALATSLLSAAHYLWQYGRALRSRGLL